MFPFYIERPRPPRHQMDQHFESDIEPEEYLTRLVMRAQSNDNYYRSSRNINAANQDERSTIKQDKDKFRVIINVQYFRAKEITVKVVDGLVVVEGKHDERTDGSGFVSRNFTRRYPLPEGVNPDLVVSKLSSGILTITAPRNMTPKNSGERIVPIFQTGPVKRQEGGAEQ